MNQSSSIAVHGQPQSAAADPRKARRFATYCLLVLTAAQVLNFLDRSIVNVLLDAIKKDMALSDTALGFIAGFGFVALYALMGLPFARLADRHGRRAVISFGIAVWSLATAAGALAQSGIQLALARTGVGIGEAAGTAPAHALLSDHFDKAARPRALSILNLGTPAGIFLGLFIGGWAAQDFGWRAALMIAGLPGLIVAALVHFTVSEPARAPRTRHEPVPEAPLFQTLSFLIRQRSYRFTVCGSFFAGFGLNAIFVWTPAFFGRVHHMPLADIGLQVGLILGLSGMIGVYLGGEIVSSLGRDDDRWKTAVPALACLLATPCLIAMLCVNDKTVALLLLALGSLLAQSILGPVFSVYQCTAQRHMRAFATAIHNLLGTLAGLGLGALLIGMTSDYFQPSYGAGSIRLALFAPIACFLPAAVLYWMAGKSIRDDIGLAASQEA